jgi:hydrogenase expression/formation protein HypC
MIEVCIAIPGLIISMAGTKAKVDFNGNIIDVETAIIDTKIGDYVLVHAGCAIEVIDKEKANEISEILKELEDIFNEISEEKSPSKVVNIAAPQVII